MGDEDETIVTEDDATQDNGGRRHRTRGRRPHSNRSDGTATGAAMSFVTRFNGFVGSAEFFRTPIAAMLLLAAAASFVPFLTVNFEMEWWSWSWDAYDALTRAKAALTIVAANAVRLAPAIFTFSLLLSRRRALHAQIGEQDEFVAIPIVAAIVRIAGEALGVYGLVLNVTGAILSLVMTGVQLGLELTPATYWESLAYVDIGDTRSLWLLESGSFAPFAQLVLAPFAAYLLVLAARWASEAMAALAAIANNTRSRDQGPLDR